LRTAAMPCALCVVHLQCGSTHALNLLLTSCCGCLVTLTASKSSCAVYDDLVSSGHETFDMWNMDMWICEVEGG